MDNEITPENKSNDSLIQDKDWLIPLINNLEKKYKAENKISFRICKLNKQSFLVKTYGLYAILPFNMMPWKYKNIAFWRTISDYLIDLNFTGSISEFKIENQVKILINSTSHIFKNVEFIEKEKYQAIILSKSKRRIFVDLGYHFKWQSGSFTCLIKANEFDESYYERIKYGDIVESYFCGFDKNNNAILTPNEENVDFLHISNIAIGSIVKTKVHKENNENLKFSIYEKYEALISAKKNVNKENYLKVNIALNKLEDNDIISCEILKTSKDRFILKWVDEDEIEEVLAREIEVEEQKITIIKKEGIIKPKQKKDKDKITDKSIIERIKPEINKKLSLIGKTIDVEIQKINENIKYIIDNKIRGDLYIYNPKYKITKSEKAIIEENFQDGEIIKCEVIKIENNIAKIKWELSDENLKRFLDLD